MRTPPRLLPALVTPFTRSGEVDLGAHRHNLTFLTDQGVKGFLLAGSTGEGPYLEPGERRSLLETARKTLGKRPFLLSGIATETTRAAIAQAEEARGDHTAIRRFYLELADSSSLPVMIYSVPLYTAYAIPTEVVVDLASHPNIVGMKDSGGDVARMAALVQATRDFFLFTGATRSITFCVASGGYGAITASSNYLGPMVLDVIANARRSPRSALAAQAELTRIASAVEAYRVPGVKAAATVVGLQPGFPRSPLAPLSARDRKRIAAILGH
jgi:dihydrodipicolinate synthase/N-acetylneuraminate lyase